MVNHACHWSKGRCNNLSLIIIIYSSLFHCQCEKTGTMLNSSLNLGQTATLASEGGNSNYYYLGVSLWLGFKSKLAWKVDHRGFISACTHKHTECHHYPHAALLWALAQCTYGTPRVPRHAHHNAQQLYIKATVRVASPSRQAPNCNDGAVWVIKGAETVEDQRKKDGCDKTLGLRHEAWEASFNCMETTERCEAAPCAQGQPARLQCSVEVADYAPRIKIT